MIWESRAFNSRAYRTTWYALNLYFGAICRWKVEGRELVPRNGPIIIASNHIALIDPVFVGSCIRRETAFMAKKELFGFPPLRALITCHNAFPIRRGGWDSQAFRLLKEKLDQGLAVLVFPEGTRSKTENFLDPKPGIGFLVRQNGVPVVPCFIRGTNQGWRKLLTRNQALAARFGQPITVAEIESFPADKNGYIGLSRLIMQRIAELKEKAR
ncbi:1-acyl-sn-glycerol-3-phosphate acyltransferase [candidate division TA06 bacterium]|uniref:1-acyl-sn-glycerol-3-phosphate acyltransferase n=1 Tax=candidate division TA06 bacterium TaxID=2250710 RepID=A0A933ML65_UNCT6|nr:1-acyl-sn-glycerol-3-phosphate acyltransferase [candidate division TA06 bacterium]